VLGQAAHQRLAFGVRDDDRDGALIAVAGGEIGGVGAGLAITGCNVLLHAMLERAGVV